MRLAGLSILLVYVSFVVGASAQDTQPAAAPASRPQSAPATSAQSGPKPPAYEWLGHGLERVVATHDDALETQKDVIRRDRDLLAKDETLGESQRAALDQVLEAEIKRLDDLATKLAKVAAVPTTRAALQDSYSRVNGEMQEILAKIANPKETFWTRGLNDDDASIPNLLKTARDTVGELRAQIDTIKKDELAALEKRRVDLPNSVKEADQKFDAARKGRSAAEEEAKARIAEGASRFEVMLALERAIEARIDEAFWKAHRDFYHLRDEAFVSLQIQEKTAHIGLLEAQAKRQAKVVEAVEKEAKRIAEEARKRAQKLRSYWEGELAREDVGARKPYIEEYLRTFDLAAELEDWKKVENDWISRLSPSSPIMQSIDDVAKLEERINRGDASDFEDVERLPESTEELRKLVDDTRAKRRVIEDVRKDLATVFQSIRAALKKTDTELREFDARLNAAREKQRALLAKDDPSNGTSDADWSSLRLNLNTNLKARIEVLERLRGEIRKWDAELEPQIPRMREVSRTINRRLIWTREESDISLEALTSALDKLTRLNQGLGPYSAELAGSIRTFVVAKENRRAVGVGILLMAILALLGRVMHRFLPLTCTWMEAHSKGTFGKIFHVVATVLRQTEYAFLMAMGFAVIPIVVGFPPRVTVPLTLLFVSPFAYRFMRVLVDVAIAPTPDRMIRVNDDLARLLHRAGRYALNVSAAFVPVGLWLEFGGYEESNAGFVQLHWLVFRILLHAVLLMTIFRPAVIIQLIRGQGDLAMTVKTSIVLAYPVIVSIVLGLFLLGSLRYLEAERYYRLIVLKSCGVLFTAALIYQIIMRRGLANREYDSSISPDEFAGASEFEEEGRRRYFNRLQRAVIRVLVFIPAIVMTIRLWPSVPEEVFTASVFGKAGGVSLRDIGLASLIVFLTFKLLRYFRDGMRFVVMPNFKLESGLRYTVLTLFSYALLSVGIIVALKILRVEGDQIAWFVSALAVGIGFGLQSIVKNFVSGLILLVERPLNVGDTIYVEGQPGKVEQITMRATTVVTGEGKAIIIPNEKMIDSPLINETMGPPRLRTSILFGVAYGSDTKTVRKTALEVVQSHGLVMKRPEAEVLFVGFGESTLDFEIRYWSTLETHRGRVSSDIRFALDAAFRRLEIEMAFPQRDLHIRSVDPKILKGLQAISADQPGSGTSNEAPRDF